MPGHGVRMQSAARGLVPVPSGWVQKGRGEEGNSMQTNDFDAAGPPTQDGSLFVYGTLFVSREANTTNGHDAPGILAGTTCDQGELRNSGGYRRR